VPLANFNTFNLYYTYDISNYNTIQVSYVWAYYQY
jgi:hypothetical protein